MRSNKTIKPKLPYARHSVRYHLCSLEDIDSVTFQPQKHRIGKAFPPEHAFVIADKTDLLVLILVAKADDGLFYTSREVMWDAGGSGGWPGRAKHDTTPGKTLREALRHELDTLGKFHFYYGTDDPISKRVRKAAADALLSIKQVSLRQMTIFDYL